MKRASYREAILWIADNDEPTSKDVSEVADMISVLLIADLFAVEPRRVARDVIFSRLKRAAA